MRGRTAPMTLPAGPAATPCGAGPIRSSIGVRTEPTERHVLNPEKLTAALAASDTAMLLIIDVLVRALDGLPGFDRNAFISRLRRETERQAAAGSSKQMIELLRRRIDQLAADQPSLLH